VDNACGGDWRTARSWWRFNGYNPIPSIGDYSNIDPSNLLILVSTNRVFQQGIFDNSCFSELAWQVKEFRNRCYGHNPELELVSVTVRFRSLTGREQILELTFGDIVTEVNRFVTEIERLLGLLLPP